MTQTKNSKLDKSEPNRIKKVESKIYLCERLHTNG